MERADQCESARSYAAVIPWKAESSLLQVLQER